MNKIMQLPSLICLLIFSKMSCAATLPEYSAFKQNDGVVTFVRDVINCDHKQKIAGYSLVFYNGTDEKTKYIQTFWDLFFNEVIVTLGANYASDIKSFEVLHFPGMEFNSINKDKAKIGELITKAMQQRWSAKKLQGEINLLYPQLAMELGGKIEITPSDDLANISKIKNEKNLPELDPSAEIIDSPRYVTHQVEIPSYDGNEKNRVNVRCLYGRAFQNEEVAWGDVNRRTSINKAAVKDVYLTYNPRYRLPEGVSAQKLTSRQLHPIASQSTVLVSEMPIDETNTKKSDFIELSAK